MNTSETSSNPWGHRIGLAVLIILAVVSLLPIWIAVKTAFTDTGAIYTSASSLLPKDATLFNFQRVLGLANPADPRLAKSGLGKIDFLRALLNSLIFTTMVVVPQIFFSAMAAFAFARLKFPGRNLIFFLFITATMIPGAVLFIPNFILMKELGWLNTFQGMAAPYALMTPFSIFFLRQMFLGTPAELEEAAHIDGAGILTIFFKIMLPLHTGSLATLTILTSIAMWNEFFWPFLIGRDPAVQVMAVAINSFRTQSAAGTPDWTGLMACTVLGVIPVALLLIFFGRKVVESIQFSGGK